MKRIPSFDLIFTMTLMCVFIVVSLLLVAMGANLYKSSIERSDTEYELRTSIAYVSNKLTADRCREVSCETADGVTCIKIADDSGGETYITYVYFLDGALCEMLVREGSDFDLSLGTTIIKLRGFDFTIDGGTVTLTSTASDGSIRTTQVYIGKGGEL